jgi:hypothetical protein
VNGKAYVAGKKKGGRENSEDRNGEIIGSGETFSILYRGNLSPGQRETRGVPRRISGEKRVWRERMTPCAD